MLNCLVNGQPRELQVSDGDGLGDVIKMLGGEMTKTGHFISSLKVNGEKLDVSFESCTGWIMADVNQLEVLTESTEHSVHEILTEGCKYLNELHCFLLQITEFYRIGDEAKGRDHFMELINGLEWFVKVASTAEMLLKIDFSETSCSGRTLSESVNSLNQILMDIIVAQKQRDWILLTDLLEYELAPQLKQWVEIFTMLKLNSADN